MPGALEREEHLHFRSVKFPWKTAGYKVFFSLATPQLTFEGVCDTAKIMARLAD